MSIISLEAPPSARQALAADIATFMGEPPRWTTEAPAFPIFVIDQTDELRVEDLDEYNQPNAWRFVLENAGGPVAIGDVTRHQVEYELSSVSEDTDRATELLKLVQFARISAVASSDFELRLFEAPAFHLRAVWLHAHSKPHSDLFILFNDHVWHRKSPMEAERFAKIFNQIRESKLGPRGFVDLDAEAGN